MIVDRQHRFVFVAVPKTGSTAMHDAFERSLGVRIPHGRELDYHATAREVAVRLGDRWPEFFSIAFVRNPYARFASAYNDFRFARRGARAIDLAFEEFCRAFPGSRWEHVVHFRPQWEFIADEADRMLVSFLGRTERVTQDWERLRPHLPFQLKSLRRLDVHTRRPYPEEWRRMSLRAKWDKLLTIVRGRIRPRRGRALLEMYDDRRARELVREYYEKDFRSLGYPTEL